MVDAGPIITSVYLFSCRSSIWIDCSTKCPHLIINDDTFLLFHLLHLLSLLLFVARLPGDRSNPTWPTLRMYWIQTTKVPCLLGARSCKLFGVLTWFGQWGQLRTSQVILNEFKSDMLEVFSFSGVCCAGNKLYKLSNWKKHMKSDMNHVKLTNLILSRF